MTEKLYIIDGHAHIYAAFYAPMAANLTAPDGEPTKATFIFTTMLLKLIKQCQPDMLAVAMDTPGPTFRHQLYQKYKANRPAMPEELPCQIERIEQILKAMHIPTLCKPGYEADDIIGTMTNTATSKKLNVYICSKDKDLEQLLDKRVFMYDPKNDQITDVGALKDKKGIQPHQVIDILALTGDTSDNIPGVPDVGAKTALQWIQKYGTLDNLITHQQEITGKRGENLRKHQEQLLLSRELVTINRQVPIEVDWDKLHLQRFDRDQLVNIFQQLGFRKLLSQLDNIASPGTGDSQAHQTLSAPSVKKCDYRLVDSPEVFEKFMHEFTGQKSFALDTETTDINPVNADLVGLSFSWQDSLGYYLPLRAPLGQKCLDRAKTLEKLKPILTDPDRKKTGQNIKYDMVVLRRAGIELTGIEFDTMVASYVLYSHRTRHNLDSLALDYLGHETIKLEELIGKGKNQQTFDMVDTRQAAQYAAEDAEVTWRLKEYFSAQFDDDELQRLFTELEMPLVNVLAEMENQGVALNIESLNKLGTQMAQRIDELVAEIHELSDCEFNVDSPKQLAEVMFDKLGLKPIKKTKTGSSTDQQVLETLSWLHPVPKLMLEYRRISKLKNTYVDKLPSMISPRTHRVHASFNQTVTATGRLSSSNPNLQNIPIRTELGQEIRRAFVPGDADAVILSTDYSQIELRMMAHFSGDKSLIEAFENDQDIHQSVAAQVYRVELDDVDKTQRSKAKAVNFGIIYGQTAFGLSRGIGVPVGEAQRFIDDYFERFPDIQRFIEKVIKQAQNDGYVRTILGRKRLIPEIKSSNMNRRRLGERMAVNTVIQGSAADLIKAAMINLHHIIKQQKLPLKLIMQVHDELVFEAPEKQAKEFSQIIRSQMCSAIKLNVPVTVDVNWGPNWLQCK